MNLVELDLTSSLPPDLDLSLSLPFCSSCCVDHYRRCPAIYIESVVVVAEYKRRIEFGLTVHRAP